MAHTRSVSDKPTNLTVVGWVSALVIFIWAAALKAKYGILSGEVGLFRTVNNWSDDWRWLILLITQFGSVFGVAVALIVAWWRHSRRLSIRIMIYTLATYLVTSWLKLLVNQPRPAGLISGVHEREVVVMNSLGFPSGHTATATVMGLLIWPVLPKRWRWTVPVAILAVAISRVYLGVHTPLDVLGGFCIGVVIVACGYIIEKLGRKA
ncbi:MAG: hypothetical protein JWS12_385 [Candidatus Saccharibacteria bacterium]|nr:hypothetical protein [Candidatus Saccharibacteria bacterium]